MSFHTSAVSRPTRRRGRVGILASLGLHAALTAALLVRFSPRVETFDEAPPIQVELVRLAMAERPPAPPAPADPAPPKPRQVIKTTVRPAPTPAPAAVAPAAPTAVEPPPPQPSPAVEPERAPPPPPAAFPRPAIDTWEGRVLARLNAVRQYPPRARQRRVQGVAYVTFRMSRNGRVLRVALERSSGSADLDRAALETVRRGQPFPAIPQDRSDEIDLIVPVEFFMR